MNFWNGKELEIIKGCCVKEMTRILPLFATGLFGKANYRVTVNLNLNVICLPYKTAEINLNQI